MNRPTATAPAYRFLADDYPQLERGPVPVEPNVSPEYFERERERIFKRCWLQVCRIEDIPQPGDYLVLDMPVWRTSVLLVHGTDGEVRAFHNVCRHRGNKVVARDGHGHGRHYACGFHGWTYDTRGALVDVPDAQQFFGLDPSCIGLKPITAGVWEGFVFLNYQAQPEWSLTEYLGPLATRFAGYPFGDMH
jgi:glycine betaine catabolism A